MGDKIFVLDSSIFIEAAKRYYAFDLAPVFWDKLTYYAEEGRIQSIDRVKDELIKVNDQLAMWAKADFVNSFYSTDEFDVIKSYRNIMTWVNKQNQYLDGAKSDFAKGADGWLIAYALSKSFVIVTQEQSNKDIKRRIPIPNVCQAFNVDFVDTFEMLRKLGVQFK